MFKTINDNPRVTDTIVFDLETPGSDGCFSANPYRVDNVTIYFVERNFLGGDYGQYNKVIYNETLEEQLKIAKAMVCDDPSPANLFAVQQLTTELASSAQTTTFYYNDALAVNSVGLSTDPAWDSTDPANAFLTNVATDADGNPQYGHFQYTWRPNGSVRGGDYFICWTWTPNPSGESLSAHTTFSLLSDPRSTVTVPSHLTPETKYNVLLDRYLPELYKTTLSNNDVTPQTLQNLNGAIARGFRDIEDQSNQVIDLFDANALHESFLLYLSNLFNLKLKSTDPTLWRRQIKEAVPLFKRKGTQGALFDAFAQANMTLNKITTLWQVVSPYTWQESFVAVSSPTFTLSKLVYRPINPAYFTVWVRRKGETEYTQLSSDYVLVEDSDCGFNSTITWIGDELSANPVNLFTGDILRVKYQYAAIPSGNESIEDYISTLPLADQRDELDQDYPKKNWNVRLIEEDDPLFQTIVPVRHPYQDPLVFGKIRTEFPYSENIYNMDSYNGSTRDSMNPCDIDRNFLDPCGSCVSSKYNIDVSVQDLCDERVQEIKDILREYTPFHSFPQSITYNGEVNEFLATPRERIEMLIQYRFLEYILPGNANPYFTRLREDGLTTWRINRDQLADQITEVSNQTGTAYNDHIALVAPSVDFSTLGIVEDNNILEVLSPSPNTGNYTIGRFSGQVANISSPVVEPLEQSMFTFHIWNVIYFTTAAIIEQDDVFRLLDEGVDYALIGVKATWDVDNTPSYTGGAWSVLIPAYSATPYMISQVLPDGSLVLADPDQTLPTSHTTNISYILRDGQGHTISTSTTGDLEIERRGRVDLNDSNIHVDDLISENTYLNYNSVEYPVSGAVDNEFYIVGYTGGNATGRTVEVRKLLTNNQVGYFNYSGMELLTSTNYEASLGILNGDNPPSTDPNDITDNSQWKENFLVQIGDDYYRITEFRGTRITLDGNPQDWGTLAAGGTLVQFSILHFVEQQVETEFVVFDQLDRSGKDPVIREIYDSVEQDVAVVALQAPGVEMADVTVNDEEITFEIQWKDGAKKKGSL